MSRSKLLVGVGATLAGVAVMLTMLAIVFQPLLLFLAIPFGAAGYLIWYQGTGRLAERVRRQADRARAQRAVRERARMGDGGRDPREDPRWADPEFAERRRRARQRVRGEDPGARDRGRTGRGSGFRRPGAGDGPTVSEAYRVLGVDPDADEERIRQAYRDRVKEVHPDADDGDEEEFKRVTEAYETLQDRVL